MSIGTERTRPRIFLVADFLEEEWPSMDLAAEQLALHLRLRGDVDSVLVRPSLKLARPGQPANTIERALGRFAQLPVELSTTHFEADDYFHVADHSYAHLALLFPRDRVGIYCHDIDAFRAALPGSHASWSRRMLSRLLIRGLRHARVVFHSTSSVREEILEHQLVPTSRLVQAPLGIASEFLEAPSRSASKRAYVLHVGSCTPRKNIEFLLKVFAETRERIPDLELVQVGGPWTNAQRAYIEQRRLTPHIQQMSGISRDELARLYAESTAVLVPSLSEGFGLPVVEALACGAPVIASDIAVLREVGFEGVRFCSLTSLNDWTRAVERVCTTGERPSPETRDRIRARYTWRAQAQIVGDAYLRR